MRPTFLGFETARKGMAANQKAIDVTGQNIVNINTPGYTRQRLDLVSMTTSGLANRFAEPTANMAGQGVKMVGVGQIRNSYLDSRFREEIANTSYYDKAMSITEGIESALNEVSAVGLNSVLSDFINGALQEFHKKPKEVTSANIVMSSAKNITQLIRQYDTQLSGLAEQQYFDLEVEVNRMNATLEKIAALNKQISDEQVHNQTGNMTYGVNELLDQRNLLLDDLATFGNIRVTDEADGSVTVVMNEQVVVKGKTHDKVNLAKSGNDHTVLVTWEGTGKNVVVESGSLRANIDLINGVAGEAKGVQFYRNQLDLFASKFASVLNSAFKTKDGSGNDINMQLINERSDIISASNISINKEWLANSAIILNDIQRQGDLDQAYILKLINNLEGKQTIGTFEGSLAEFVDYYNTTLGQDLTYYKGRFEASLSVADDLNDRRDAISAVNLDEEGSYMMMYEKAYQATARLMTTLDEALDVLINRTGLVGR